MSLPFNRREILKQVLISFLTALVVLFLPLNASSEPAFFYVGDGTITLSKGLKGTPETIRFRKGERSYDESALKRINDIFGADWKRPEWRVSLRLIELLDFIQDHFKGGNISIIDGFRSAEETRSMRARGKLAALSSLHMDGEAADIIMAGVKSVDVRDFLIPLNCCGVGYYHGKAIHVDIGPPRFWDEKTSGTEKKEPPMNEKIIVRTDKDIYYEGEPLLLQFSRVNIYPFGIVRKMRLEILKGDKWKSFDIAPDFLQSVKSGGSQGCMVIACRKEGRNIEWRTKLPDGKTARCRIHVDFCKPKTEKMPAQVTSNEFLIISKRP